MCFELSGNLHTNLGNGVENLKIRSWGDNRCESAKTVGLSLGCHDRDSQPSLERDDFDGLKLQVTLLYIFESARRKPWLSPARPRP